MVALYGLVCFDIATNQDVSHSTFRAPPTKNGTPSPLCLRLVEMKLPASIGGAMAIVSFIEQEDQADVIGRILKHCQLWGEYPARAPPKPAAADEFELEIEYVDFDEFLMGF